jgi:hypothetical protein
MGSPAMTLEAALAAQASVLAVGDQRRPSVGRAVLGSLLAAAVFEVFAFGVKQWTALSSHSPWSDDPYDAVTSFAIFFVPLVAGLCLLRLPLCRRDEPLPVERVQGLLRGARLILGTVAVTLLSDWIAVGLRVNSGSWSGETVALVAALVLVSVLTAWAVVEVLRGPGIQFPDSPGPATGPDGLADLITVATRLSARLGPLGPLGGTVVRATDAWLVRPIRSHPLLAAGAASVLFGALIAVGAAREDGLSPVLWPLLGVGSAGMFAFLAAGGSYLRLVIRERPIGGRQRRLADALVIAAASVPIALAFRDSLWPLIGVSPASAGIVELEALLVAAAATTFLAIVAAESVAGSHSR